MAGPVPMPAPSPALAPPGIGDLCYLCPEWVAAARDVLVATAARHSEGLRDLGQFTLCEVAHNPPWHSSPYGESYKSETKPYTSPANGPGRVLYGNKLAWWVRFRGASVDAQEGELPASECDLKIQGDHGIMSRLARVLNSGVDPQTVAAAKAQLMPQSRWVVEGKMKEHEVLKAVMSGLHDAMAARTIPRFVWMSRDWVSSAREIITARASNPKFCDDARRQPMLKDVNYIFAEEFTDPPRYVSPDGSSSGFWVAIRHGNVTVGSGRLPKEYGEPDTQTKGQYVPILVGGRTVNAALNKEEQAMISEHSARLPRMFNGKPTMTAVQRVKKGSVPMPISMSLLLLPMHDELSLRASGEVPSDFDPSIQDGGAPPFDRSSEYGKTWLRYDKVDVYGQPLAQSKL